MCRAADRVPCLTPRRPSRLVLFFFLLFLSSFSPASLFQSTGRYQVELDSDETLSVKPDNILQMIDGARVIGVTSKPEMNGQKGAILNFDQDRGNYHIRLPSQSVALKYRRRALSVPFTPVFDTPERGAVLTHRSNVRSPLGAIVADARPGSLPDWCRLPLSDQASGPTPDF